VETYIANKPYENGHTKFRVQFPGVSVPSKSTTHQMVNKSETMGSFLNKMQQQA
jgi:hypothetical protein